MKFILAFLAILISAGAVRAQSWPGQCPVGVASTSIGCQPQATSPISSTDLVLGWQIGSSPHTVAMQAQQLWNANASGTFSALTVSGLVSAGTLSSAGLATLASVTAGSASITTNETVGGTLGVTGNTTVGGTLGVTGATTLAGLSATSSAISGNATVGGTMGVTGNLTAGSATVTGNETVGGTLGVTGTATFQGVTVNLGMAVTGNETVGGTLGVTGATTVGGTLGVTGNTTLAGLSAPPIISGAFYGMKCDGVTNDTTAFQNAASASASGGILFLPAGTCLMNATIGGNYMDIVGTGPSTIIKPFAAGNAILVQSTSYSRIRDLSIQSNGFGSGSGIVLASTVNNTELRNLYVLNFPTYNVDCEGVVGTQPTGNSLVSSTMLSNATNSANVRWNYCNASHITDNVIGSSTGITTSGPGVLLNNSVAVMIRGNLITRQSNGVVANSSGYSWITENQIEFNGAEGIDGTTNTFLTITGNQLYTNSQTVLGGVAHADFVALTNSTISNNSFFDTNAVNSTNYSLTLDATSLSNTVTGNLFSYYTTAPTFVATAAQPYTILDDNQPTFTAGANFKPVNIFSSITAGGVGGGGATIYLGVGGNGINFNAVQIPIASMQTVQCLSIATGFVPGAGNTYVYRLYKTGVATGLVATQASGSFTASVCDRTNQVSVSSSDTIAIRADSSASAPSNQFFFSIAGGP